MTSLFEQRASECARSGHQPPVVWRIRWRGRLWVRLLCSHCGATRPAALGDITFGARTVSEK